MKRYTPSEEEAVHTERLVREWARSGLFDPPQAELLRADLSVDLRRTNNFLRAVLFVFGVLIIASAVLLVITELNIDEEVSVAATTAGAALVCFVAADFMVTKFRVYRFGVEEAFAVAAAAFLAAAAAVLGSSIQNVRSTELPAFAGLITASAGMLVVYRRFGYIYAAIAAIGCFAFACFQTGQSPTRERLLAAAVLIFFFLFVGARRRSDINDYRDGDFAILQAVAWGGLYVTINVHLFGRYVAVGLSDAFYWSTYALIWLIPAIGIYLGLKKKDRPILDVSLSLGLATLATNKSYLGLTRQTWDPILLGMLLITVAIVVRRWLAAGRDGNRHGFTASRLLHSDKRAVAFVGAASVAMQHDPARASESSEPGLEPGGGRSGGAGASGGF